jgi:hypothetical protein
LTPSSKRHVLTVGTTGDYRPFTALDKETGEYSGFDIGMASALAKALGVPIEFKPATWSGLSKGLAGGTSTSPWRRLCDARPAEGRLLLKSLPARRQDADRAARINGLETYWMPRPGAEGRRRPVAASLQENGELDALFAKWFR